MQKAPILLTSLFLLVVSISPAHASVSIWGISVPSSFSEMRTMIERRVETWFPGLPFTDTTTSNENGDDESSLPQQTVVDMTVGGKRITRTDSIQFDEKKGPTHEVLTVTQTEIDRALQTARGKSYQGFTISAAKVKLGYDAATVSIDLTDGRALDVDLELTNNGKDVQVKNITDRGSKKLNFAEKLVIPTLIRTGVKMAKDFSPQNAERFRFAVVRPESLEFWLTAEKHLDK